MFTTLVLAVRPAPLELRSSRCPTPRCAACSDDAFSPAVAPALPRRGAIALAAASLSTSGSAGAVDTAGRGYGPLIQGPFDFPSAARATVRRELRPGRIWSFEQVQGVIYVHVPVRMTVIKLDAGGLFAYAPVAPTAECLRLLAEVEAEHGRVAHILLPTLAIEHKSFAGAFAAARPDAQLWVADAQYSFPLDLPLGLQGFPPGTKPLPAEADASAVPWAAQLPYRVLGPLREKVGGFQEVVVFDRPTGTLLVTDLVVSVPATPPAILAENDLRALLYHSRDDPSEAPIDSEATRARGWQKICMFALYFQSSPLLVAAGSPILGSPIVCSPVLSLPNDPNVWNVTPDDAHRARSFCAPHAPVHPSPIASTSSLVAATRSPTAPPTSHPHSPSQTLPDCALTHLSRPPTCPDPPPVPNPHLSPPNSPRPHASPRPHVSSHLAFPFFHRA